MHLSDEQLLAPDQPSYVHLRQCQQCNVRYQHLTGIQRQIKQNVGSAGDMPNFNQDHAWLRLKTALEERQVITKITPLITVKKAYGNNFWRNCTVALAASILLTVFVGFNNLNSSVQGIDAQSGLLVQLISENNRLQQQILSLNSANNHTKAQLALISARIRQHDLSLQQAYLVNKTDAEKIKLWQQRKDILKRAVSAPTNKLISI